jgi:hypothetical protein
MLTIYQPVRASGSHGRLTARVSMSENKHSAVRTPIFVNLYFSAALLHEAKHMYLRRSKSKGGSAAAADLLTMATPSSFFACGRILLALDNNITIYRSA